jgi:hypothetical protein
MEKKCFTIQSGDGSKYKIVVTYKNGIPEIYIGGSKYYCISVTGFILDVKSGNKCHDLHIRNVNFSHKASDMMKALLYFMRTKGDEIGYSGPENPCKITFTDTSENQFCGNLSSYYLAFEQQTWYEKDFGAYLINNEKTKLTPREKYELQIPEKYMIHDVFDVVNRYKDQKKIFEDTDKYTELKHHFETHYIRRYIDEINGPEVLRLYNESKNFKEFFQKIKGTFGDRRCKQLNLPLWLDDFVKYYLGFKFLKNQIWKIDCDKVLMGAHEIQNCDNNVPKNYLTVNQTGSGEKKKLTTRQRESYTCPNWIGWINMNINEYRTKDRVFLKNLIKEFNA